MEKLAEGLQRLGEEDLLHVVQMVHDNKSEETYTKNDVESERITVRYFELGHYADTHTDGEFHVDLYTLPDALVKMLWDFVSNKVDMSTL